MVAGLGTSAVGASAGIGLLVAAQVAATAAAVSFTVSVAKSVDAIGDMAEKVNFSVRTISGLAPAIEQAGGSVEGFTTALGIFDKNIEAVAQGEERMSKLFKALNIDAKDNEKAFRQVAKVLTELGGTSQQTALAMELFGRSGKDVLGAIKAAGGDVEAFIKQMEALGIVIDQDTVKKADALDRQLVILSNQFDAIKRQLASELIPLVQQGSENISNWMRDNQGEIRKTIGEVGNLIKKIGELSNFIMSINPIVLTVKVVSLFSQLFPDNSRTSGAAQAAQQDRNLFTIDPATGRRIYQGRGAFDIAGEFAIPGGAGSIPGTDQRTVGAGIGAGGGNANNALADRVRSLLARGGGGGGRGGGSARDVLESLRSTLINLNAEWRRWDVALLDSAASTAEAAQKQTLLDNVMSSLSSNAKLAISGIRDIDEALEKAVSSLPKKSQDTARALIAESLAISKQNQEKQAAIEIDKEATRITQAWRLEIDNSRTGADEFTRAIQQLEKAYGKYGKEIDPATRKELEHLAAQQRLLQVTRERVVVLNQLRARVVGGDVLRDLGEGSVVFRGEATRERIATAGEQVLRDREQMRIQEMREIAEDLGAIFGDAFESIRGGWENLWQDMANIARSISRQIVQELFTGLFSKALNVPFESRSGGLVGGIINRIFGARNQGGGIDLGGGSVFMPGGTGTTRPRVAGSRALGGPVEAGLLYRVNETRQEFFKPNQSGQVIPLGPQQGPNISRLYLVDDERAAFERGATRREIAKVTKQTRKVGKLVGM